MRETRILERFFRECVQSIPRIKLSPKGIFRIKNENLNKCKIYGSWGNSNQGQNIDFT
jgi:hypothetical protein